MKNKKKIKLLNLYLAYHFNKVSLLIFVISLILLSIVFLLNSGFPLENIDYLKNYAGYHQHYFEQSVFFMQIINGVIIAFLIGLEVNSTSSFDTMFVASKSRFSVIISRIISILIIIIIFITFEILLLNLIAVIVFNYYTFDFKSLFLIFYLFFQGLEVLLISEFIGLIFDSYFISILSFIFNFLIIILSRNMEIKEVLFNYFPIVYYENELPYVLTNISIYFGICFILLVGIILFYQKKDLIV